MSTGRVCSIHNEWCADGQCRWCEPLPRSPGVVITATDLDTDPSGAYARAFKLLSESCMSEGRTWGFPVWGHWL